MPKLYEDLQFNNFKKSPKTPKEGISIYAKENNVFVKDETGLESKLVKDIDASLLKKDFSEAFLVGEEIIDINPIYKTAITEKIKDEIESFIDDFLFLINGEEIKEAYLVNTVLSGPFEVSHSEGIFSKFIKEIKIKFDREIYTIKPSENLEVARLADEIIITLNHNYEISLDVILVDGSIINKIKNITLLGTEIYGKGDLELSIEKFVDVKTKTTEKYLWVCFEIAKVPKKFTVINSNGIKIPMKSKSEKSFKLINSRISTYSCFRSVQPINSEIDFKVIRED